MRSKRKTVGIRKRRKRKQETNFMKKMAFLKLLGQGAEDIGSFRSGEDLLVERNWKYVQKEIITNDITEKGEGRHFYPMLEALEVFPETLEQCPQAFPHAISNKSIQKSFDCIKSKKSIYRTYGSVLLISDACIQFLSFSLEEVTIKDLCQDHVQGLYVEAQENENENLEKYLNWTHFLGEHHVLPHKYYSNHNYTETFSSGTKQRISSIACDPRFKGNIAIAYRIYNSEVEEVTFEDANPLDLSDKKVKATDDDSAESCNDYVVSDCKVTASEGKTKADGALRGIKTSMPSRAVDGMNDSVDESLAAVPSGTRSKCLMATTYVVEDTPADFGDIPLVGEDSGKDITDQNRNRCDDLIATDNGPAPDVLSPPVTNQDYGELWLRPYIGDITERKFEDVCLLDLSENEAEATKKDSVESCYECIISNKELNFDISDDKTFSHVSDDSVLNDTGMDIKDFTLAVVMDNDNISSDAELEYKGKIGIGLDDVSDYDIDSLDSSGINKLFISLSGGPVIETEAATAGIALPDDVSAVGEKTALEGVTEADEALRDHKTAMPSIAFDEISDLVDESAEDSDSVMAATLVVSLKSVVTPPTAIGTESAEDGDHALVMEYAEGGESVVVPTYVVSPKSVKTTTSAVGVADLNLEGFDGITTAEGGLAPDDEAFADLVSVMDNGILEEGDNSHIWGLPQDWNVFGNLEVSDKGSDSSEEEVSSDDSSSLKEEMMDDSDTEENWENFNDEDVSECWEDLLYMTFRSESVHPPKSDFSEDENFGMSEEEHFIEEDLKFESTPDYEIIEWKLEKEPHPMRIIIWDCEISLLQYNPDYPTLLAGANNDGQIFLWDMSNYDVPTSVYNDHMASIFCSEIVPWTCKPPPVAYVAIESCEVHSHLGEIYDMQWVPSSSRRPQDCSLNIIGKGKRSLLVTASGDGTVGILDLHMGYPLSKEMKHRHKHVANGTPVIPPFPQYDRPMQPVKYVMATMNGEPIPVTAITVNNLRQWIGSGLQRTDNLNYASMTNAIKMQWKMMHACITAGFSSGQVMGMFPDIEHYEKKGGLDDPHFYKEYYWIPRNESYNQHQGFKHEGPVLCLKRSCFADDIILSVSEKSFCVWKVQSRLYRGRNENISWLHSWFNEEAHGPPLHNRILPICWHRINISNDYYTTGEWSPLCSSQFFLPMSNGLIEVYDVNVREEGPLATVYMGSNMIHYVLPLMCSNECDDLAFIEDEVLFYVKMPEYCKTKNIAQFKDLQKFVNHEAWRRGLYSSWCHQFNQEYREYVRERVLDANDLFDESRYGRIKGVYKYIRLMRAKAEKAKQAKKAFIDLYEDRVPGGWWNQIKKRGGNYGVLERKKNLMSWYDWKIIIFDLILEDTMLFKTIYEPTRVVFKPWERSKEAWIERMLKRVTKEHFDKFWTWGTEQIYAAYKQTFDEESDEDIPAAQIVDRQSDKYQFTALKRQREYGLTFEFVDYYEAERIRDLGKIKERIGRLEFGAIKDLVSKTMFSQHLNKLHVQKMTHGIPNLTHKCNLPGATSPLNKVWDMWTLLQVIDKDPLLTTANLPPLVGGKKSAVDYANFYFQ